MKLLKRRLMLVGGWVALLALITLVFIWALGQGDNYELPAVQSAEQAELHAEFVAKHVAEMPVKQTVLETGEPIYRLYDGSLSDNLPKWYQDGKIVLTEDEGREIRNLAIINTPWWVFWTDEMTVGDYTGLVDGLVAGLVIGLVFGLVFGLVAGLVIGLVYGLVAGLVFGLVLGLVYGLVLGLVYGLVTHTEKYWPQTSDVSTQT